MMCFFFDIFQPAQTQRLLTTSESETRPRGVLLLFTRYHACFGIYINFLILNIFCHRKREGRMVMRKVAVKKNLVCKGAASASGAFAETLCDVKSHIRIRCTIYLHECIWGIDVKKHLVCRGIASASRVFGEVLCDLRNTLLMITYSEYSNTLYNIWIRTISKIIVVWYLIMYWIM